MTCIVALEDNDRVYFGADSAITQNWDINASVIPKIFKLGKFIFGVAGYPRVAQIIQYRLKLESQPKEQTDLEYLCTHFVDKMIETLHFNDFGETKDGKKTFDSIILFGYHGKIYEMDNNYQIVKYKLPYVAIGSGKDLALGAMYACPNYLSPKFRIKTALKAASQFNIGVSEPFTFLSMK